MHYYITRSLFQDMLRQALVQTERCPCLGLLGGEKDSALIDRVWYWRGEQQAAQTLAQWADAGVACKGMFYLRGHAVPQAIFGVMPEPYLELMASLDEKGRLDMLAHVCMRSAHQPQTVTLELIEDGQQTRVA